MPQETTRTEAERVASAPRENARDAWSFVPTLYVAQGLPYFVVNTATTTLFKLLGLSLESIGAWTALLTGPWSAKALWSPLVDASGAKRRWVVATELALALALGVLAWVVDSHATLAPLAIVLALIAILSATHDIACDGLYMLALDEERQARFVGVRSAGFRLAKVLVTGGVVALAGILATRGASVPRAWSLALGATAVLYAALAAWNFFALPRPAADVAARTSSGRTPLAQAFAEWLRTPGIVALFAFIFLYRAGELMLTTIAPVFLIETREKGGAGLSTQSQGLWYGTLGVLALLAGGWLSGVAIARFGLRRCLWPFALSMHAPNLLFAWLAYAQPGEGAIACVVLVEQLGYGLGFSAFMVVLLAYSRRSRWPTSHYAISTGFMGLSGMGASALAGTLAQHLGYAAFFGIVCAAAVPGLLVLALLKIPGAQERAQA